MRIRGLSSALVAITLAVSAVLTVIGVVVDWRLLGTLGQNMPTATTAMATVSGGAILAVLALITLVRPGSRHVGALAGTAAALLVPLPALDALWYVSTSTQLVAVTVPWVRPAVLLLSASMAAVFLAGAIWWAPTPSHRRSRSDSEGETP